MEDGISYRCVCVKNAVIAERKEIGKRWQKKMLLFDLLSAQPVHDTKYHGGGEYIKSVFKSLMEAGGHREIAVCFDSGAFLDDWVIELVKVNSIASYQVSNWDDIRQLLSKGIFDKFFSGLPRSIVRQSESCTFEYVGTIHGLRPIEKPFDRYAVSLTRGSKEKAKVLCKRLFHKKIVEEYATRIDSLDIVLTDSRHSEYAIKSAFGKEDVLVLYPPFKRRQLLPDAVGDIQGKYILLIGCNRWEKNPIRALRAIDSLFEKNLLREYRVVCVGVTTEIDAFGIRNKERFVVKGYVEANELEALYKGSDIFFYPSLNEGFGYPPLEALAYGKTCVVSGVCSLPEICGNAVYYVNPYDLGEMQARLLEASERKIEQSVIASQLKRIEAIQARHLDTLVNLLLG